MYPFLFGWKQHTVDLAVWWSTVAHNMYSYTAGSLPEACLAKAWSQRLPTRRQGQKSCVVSTLKVGVTHCGYIQKYTGKGSQNHELANIGACSKFKLLHSSIVLFEVLLTHKLQLMDYHKLRMFFLSSSFMILFWQFSTKTWHTNHTNLTLNKNKSILAWSLSHQKTIMFVFLSSTSRFLGMTRICWSWCPSLSFCWFPCHHLDICWFFPWSSRCEIGGKNREGGEVAFFKALLIVMGDVFLTVMSPQSVVKHMVQWGWGEFFLQKLDLPPLKTNECPLKINGWKMYSLLE